MASARLLREVESTDERRSLTEEILRNVVTAVCQADPQLGAEWHELLGQSAPRADDAQWVEMVERIAHVADRRNADFDPLMPPDSIRNDVLFEIGHVGDGDDREQQRALHRPDQGHLRRGGGGSCAEQCGGDGWLVAADVDGVPALSCGVSEVAGLVRRSTTMRVPRIPSS